MKDGAWHKSTFHLPKPWVYAKIDPRTLGWMQFNWSTWLKKQFKMITLEVVRYWPASTILQSYSNCINMVQEHSFLYLNFGQEINIFDIQRQIVHSLAHHSANESSIGLQSHTFCLSRKLINQIYQTDQE